MRVDYSFTPDAPWQFLMALNASYMFIPQLTELERIPAPPPLNYSWRPKDNALDQEVREACVSHLRRLADEWINSGRWGDVDSPLERELNSELRWILNVWAGANKPDITFDKSGNTVLQMPPIEIDYKSPVAAAKNAAVLLFGVFLDTPFRSRLFKCQQCKIYYYTERKPRGPIKYGTYCSLHRHAASARRSNEQRRGPEHERKLDLAAQCWKRWPKRMTDKGQQAEWVAAEVNRRLDRVYSEIKRNWVTRNRAAIASRTPQGLFIRPVPADARCRPATGEI